MQMEGIITTFVSMGMVSFLVVIGLGELSANPYSYSGTQPASITRTR
jgi:hypothetical protein